MRITRKWAMPNADTFSIAPIASLLDTYLKNKEVIVDPFARNSKRATITNDLNPNTTAQYHLLAEKFLENAPMIADVVLFDPPYSPRQISEVYQSVGIKVGMKETQSASMYKTVKDGLDAMLKPNGIAICFGWNSMGFGLTRGYEMIELLLVPHGGAHNDTIVTVERKIVK
jgi:hypothetical protein